MTAAVDVPGLFDDDVLVLSAEVFDGALASLRPDEDALVARAVDKRRREFATARWLAHAGLARLGRPVAALLNAPDRAPIWPEGVTGSISHCDTRAVVAVAPWGARGTVGVDVEHRDGLRRELWRTVFSATEIARLDAAFDEDARARMALVLFSAKEALYKAQYAWSSTFMGFHELEVELAAPSAGWSAFSCTFQNEVGPFAAGTRARGRYRLDAFPGGEVVTAIRVHPRALARGEAD